MRPSVRPLVRQRDSASHAGIGGAKHVFKAPSQATLEFCEAPLDSAATQFEREVLPRCCYGQIASKLRVCSDFRAQIYTEKLNAFINVNYDRKGVVTL
jgi:hypothetical protein